jgi:SAM-dependent methyltransferase
MIEGKSISEVVQELLQLRGKRILDVGCGDGVLARQMAAHGARVTGIEPNGETVARARAIAPVDGEVYLHSGAQEMPIDDGSMDGVVFSNSLHHVPAELQHSAVKEAARVVIDDGLVLFAEPLAEGPHFELGRPLEDETEIRAHAYAVICEAGRHGLVQLREDLFVRPSRFADVEAFRKVTTRINPDRGKIFAQRLDQIRACFERPSRRIDGISEFDQPIRINLFKKTAQA